MPEAESVTRWIEQVKEGSETAMAQLWNHFYSRLVALARVGTANQGRLKQGPLKQGPLKQGPCFG